MRGATTPAQLLAAAALLLALLPRPCDAQEPAGQGWADRAAGPSPSELEAADAGSEPTDSEAALESDPESLLNLVPPGLSVDPVLEHTPGPGADSGERLKSILARPEFSTDTAAPQQTWLDKLMAWLQRLLSRNNLRTPAWLGQGTGAVLIALIFVLLCYIIARLLWGFVALRRRRQLGEQAVEELPSRPQELLAQAKAALARGDLRGALRLRFRAVIAALELPSSSLQTNSQLARVIRREAPEAAAPFARLSACFEDVWYGGAVCLETQYREADSLAELVEAALAQALASRRAEAAA
jgi:hypothetical protein